MVNAILYLNRTGCSWRMLPHEFSALGHGALLLPPLPARRRVAGVEMAFTISGLLGQSIFFHAYPPLKTGLLRHLLKQTGLAENDL